MGNGIELFTVDRVRPLFPIIGANLSASSNVISTVLDQLYGKPLDPANWGRVSKRMPSRWNNSTNQEIPYKLTRSYTDDTFRISITIQREYSGNAPEFSMGLVLDSMHGVPELKGKLYLGSGRTISSPSVVHDSWDKRADQSRSSFYDNIMSFDDFLTIDIPETFNQKSTGIMVALDYRLAAYKSIAKATARYL